MRTASLFLALLLIGIPARAQDAAQSLEEIAVSGPDAARLQEAYAGTKSRAAPVLEPSPDTKTDPEINPDLLSKQLVLENNPSITAEILARLHFTPEGRAMLRETLAALSKPGAKPFRIRFARIPGTQISVEDGMESLENANEGYAEPENRLIALNDAFLRFKDRDAALDAAAATLAHELSHLLWESLLRQRFPSRTRALAVDLANEIRARLRSGLAAAQLHGARPSEATSELQDLLANPDAYWDAMKLWNTDYALALDRAEMSDPLQAYTNRLNSLEEALTEAQSALEDVRLLLKRIEHFERSHDALTALRLRRLSEKTQSDLRTLPQDLKDYNSMLRQVRRRLSHLRSQRGRSEMTQLKAAAQDPDYGMIDQENSGLLAAIREETAAHPLPKLDPDPSQLDRPAFEELVRQDRAQNPSHIPDLD